MLVTVVGAMSAVSLPLDSRTRRNKDLLVGQLSALLLVTRLPSLIKSWYCCAGSLWPLVYYICDFWLSTKSNFIEGTVR